MLIRYIAAITISLAPCLASAAPKLPSFPKNTGYDRARESLIALKWAPAPTTADPARCSIGFEDRCKNYPEAVSCAGTGTAPCLFLWKSPEGVLIEVNTIGEEDPPIVRGVRCQANCR